MDNFNLKFYVILLTIQKDLIQKKKLGLNYLKVKYDRAQISIE
jgi:hypothetical protein